MWRELDIAGVFMTPLVVYMAAALVAYLPVRWLLVRARLDRYVWNPPLVDAALYLCVLGLLVGLL